MGNTIYNLIPIICGFVILGLALFMTMTPKEATRKDCREDEEIVKKTRKKGVILLIFSIAFIIFSVVMVKIRYDLNEKQARLEKEMEEIEEQMELYKNVNVSPFF